MRTFEEIRALLAQKFHKEKLRLKSYGTKSDSFQLANVTARYVQALMSESRYRELKKVNDFVEKHARCDPRDELHPYIKERLKATKAMAKAIEHVAEETEKNRPWKRKKEKKKKHHRKKK